MSSSGDSSTTSSNQGTAATGTSQWGQNSTSGQTASGNSGSQGQSTYGQNNPTSTTGSTDSSTGGQNSTGSNVGQSGTASDMGSASAQNSTTGSTYGSGSTAGNSSTSMDRSSTANMQHIRGRVSRVDQDNNSITLDRGLTLKVDDSTEIVGVDSSTSGISSLHEGQQVRASYDSSSNSAKKIEVVGKKSKKSMKSHGSTSSSDTSSVGSDTSSDSSGTSKARIPNPNTATTPAQGTTGGSDGEKKQ
jgi:hypothetical protein